MRDTRVDDRRFHFSIVASLLLLVAVRLPQLTSDLLLMDHDEAVIGVMARLITNGEHIPIFMVGQRYGFSLFEAGMTALSTSFLGPTPLAIKTAMLSLWCIGAIFFIMSLREFFGARIAATVAPLIAVAPGWAVWSMKARGGYITAFVCSSIALWLVARLRQNQRVSAGMFILLGACTALTYLAHRFFFLALLPFFLLLKGARRTHSWAALGAFLATITLIRVAARNDWVVRSLRNFRVEDTLGDVATLPERVWIALSGGYYYWLKIIPGPWTVAAATLWSLVLVIGFSAAAATSLRQRAWSPLHAACLAILGTLATTFIVDAPPGGFPYRYLLPLTPLILILISAWLEEVTRAGRRNYVRLLTAAVVLIAIVSAGATLEFGRVAMAGKPPGKPEAQYLPEIAAVSQVLDTLRSASITHVYTLDVGLQWTLMYLSGGAITARSIPRFDRYPPFAERVDRALHGRQPVALVAYDRDWQKAQARKRANPSSIHRIGNRFVLIPYVTPQMLTSLGFRLTPPSESAGSERP
jgi:hypothetical protein